MKTFHTVTREQLLSLSVGRDAIVFEALPEAHWASGHIPGAVAMPLDRIAEVAASAAPNRKARVIVYCASETCHNSHIAADRLVSLGYANVGVYPGGKADWKAGGLSLEVSR